MVTRIIQAVAGAGKTRHITHDLNNCKRYLLITYTNANTNNIKKELLSSSLSPDQYIVATFSKFLIDWFINPYLSSLKPHLPVIKGFTTAVPSYYSKDNPYNNYIRRDNVNHYVVKNNLYLDRISELVSFQTSSLLDKMFKRISLFVDEVIIDEYQDLTGYDFSMLQLLVKQKYFDVLLIGDVYQAGVQRSCIRGKNSKSKMISFDSSDNIKKFLKNIFKSKNLEIDDTSLVKSRRISEDCAKLVNEYLNIEIESEGKSTGHVYFIKDINKLKQLLSKDESIVILTYNRKTQYPISNKYDTWTYCKGMTYKNVLVVLTDNAKFIFNGSKPKKALKGKARNCLYVALTRASHNLYLVTKDTWKEFESFY